MSNLFDLASRRRSGRAASRLSRTTDSGDGVQAAAEVAVAAHRILIAGAAKGAASRGRNSGWHYAAMARVSFSS
jgi:hypothetical protein